MDIYTLTNKIPEGYVLRNEAMIIYGSYLDKSYFQDEDVKYIENKYPCYKLESVLELLDKKMEKIYKYYKIYDEMRLESQEFNKSPYDLIADK